MTPDSMTICSICSNVPKNSSLWRLLLVLITFVVLMSYVLFQTDVKSYFEYTPAKDAKNNLVEKLKENANHIKTKKINLKNQRSLKILHVDSFTTENGSNEVYSEVLRENFNASLACPRLPPYLEGRQNITLESIPSLKELQKNYTGLLPGGRHHPVECEARQREAIVIPFRDREQHLTALLYYLHPFLQRQKLEYGIYVIEQAGWEPFNRGALMNVGFLEALKLHPYDCFIFHDVDLIPEDDRNLYICRNQPTHLSVAVNTLKYKLPYKAIFGGVSAMATDHIRKVNGFSNLFWGWGGEDDDMSWRVTSHGFKIFRYPESIARYTMIPHKQQKPNPIRTKLLKGKALFSKNGLNTIKYTVLEFKLTNLYTWIKVKLRK